LSGSIAPGLIRHRGADTQDLKREFKAFPDPPRIADKDKC
jgi:hypothetical protein